LKVEAATNYATSASEWIACLAWHKPAGTNRDGLKIAPFLSGRVH
jgi:hypothetical protein